MKRIFCYGLLTIIIIVCAQATTVSDSSPLSLKITSGTLETKRDVAVPTRDIIIGNDGAQVSYSFENVMLSKQSINQKSGRFGLEYPGFRSAMGDGLPQVPMRADVFVVAESSAVKISIESSEYVDYKMELAPSLPAVEESEEAKFVKVMEIADYDGFYPKEPVMEIQSSLLHNLKLVYVQVSPVQYDNKNKSVRIYSKLAYRVSVDTPDEFYASIGQRELDEIVNLQRSGAESLLNLDTNMSKLKFYQPKLQSELNSNDGYTHDGFERVNNTYLIISDWHYTAAAKKLAEWKKTTGYNAFVETTLFWSAASVKSKIEEYYAKLKGAGMYCLFLGSNSSIPCRSSLIMGKCYESDNPYFCLKGNDEIPEVKYGRIPCTSLEEANIAVDKIINYEKNPPSSSLFYKTGIHIAQFQDFEDEENGTNDSIPNGYEDRRFTQTSYEIGRYLRQNAMMSIKEHYRLYQRTECEHFVWHWSKLFSYGQAVPSDVHISCDHYQYNFDKFSEWLHTGALYVLYRGHGSRFEWGNTGVNQNTFAAAKNGNNLPFCFNICCNNGINMGIYFPNKMLMNSDGGAIGCVASTNVSYSGPNDGLAHGIFNAFWPSSGIVSDFCYPTNTSDGNVVCNTYVPNTSTRTYEVFEALQQGFLRAEQIYPTLTEKHKAQRLMFHLFGDPAQILYLGNPYSLRSHTDFSVTRTVGQVSVNYPYANGVITIYDTMADTVKSFIGASTVVYDCDDPESVVVSVKSGAALTQVNAGSNVNL